MMHGKTEHKRVRIGLKPIAEDGETRPVPRIPADPSDYCSNPERELGIEYDSNDDEPTAVSSVRGRIVQSGEPLDALTFNFSHTRICAGGARGVLKIYNVHEDNTLEESVDFRRVKTKRLTLLYSPLDVTWNPIIENRLASTSTNGAVVFWDVEQGRLLFHYKEHTRSATCIKYHLSEPDIIMSGSKDATVLLYDLRVGSSVSKFAKGGFGLDAVRDLQWCMHQHDLFVSCDDAGTVRLWDRRRTDKPYLHFPAHHGYVSSAQFAPTSRTMLATGGGRDKYIKIWDWSRPIDEGPIYAFETVAAVCKAIWRPHGKGSTQIASCSVVNDTNIHIWDVRRPFMPYASFHDHRDSACAIAFFPNDESKFISGGKDGLVIVHEFPVHARYPINYANDISIDTAPDGLIGVAVNSLAPEKLPFVERQAADSMYSNPKPPKPPFVLQSILSTASSLSSQSSFSSSSGRGTASSSLSSSPAHPMPKRVTIIDPKDRAKGPVPTRPQPGCVSLAAAMHAAAAANNSTYDPFRGPTQSLIRCGQPEHAAKHLTQRCFVELALEYRMGGAPPPQLAGFNSDVAARHGLHDIARAWRLITGLILHDLRATGYPSEWRTDEIDRRKGRQEQLGIQMAEEGEYMSRTVYMENGRPQNGVRQAVRPTEIITDFVLDRYEPGFRDDVLLRKKRRGRRETKKNGVEEEENLAEDDTSGEEDGMRGEDAEKRTSRLAKWRMKTRLRAKDKTNQERVPRTEAPSPVHDPMDDDVRYGAFGEYHYGLQPTDVRRKTNEDLAWHGSARSSHTWRTLPDEAFEVQSDVGVRMTPETAKKMKAIRPSRDGSRSAPSSPSGADAPCSKSERDRLLVEEEMETAASSVEEMLRRHADANDIQTCAVISIVFGRLMIDLLGEPLVFSWISAYESMLDRLRLMTAVTEVRKYCMLPAIAEKSLSGTFIKMGCVYCRKLVTGGKCERCSRKVAATLCSICHRELTGLGWSCDGCGHAAHSKHARDWFDRFPQCPVSGCDCECAYWEPPEDAQPLLLRPTNLKKRPERAPQRPLTVESFLICDQLMAAELQEEFYAKRAWKLRAKVGTEEYVRGLIMERNKKVRKLKRHGVNIGKMEYDRWRNLSSSSEEEVMVYRKGKAMRIRRKKKKDRKKIGGPLYGIHLGRSPFGPIRGGGLEKKKEEGEEEMKEWKEYTVVETYGETEEEEIEDEESEPEEVEWDCSCGFCMDCLLMADWRDQLDDLSQSAGGRLAAPGAGARWTRSGREEREASDERAIDGFARSLQRAMTRDWGQRRRWKRMRGRRFRPILMEGLKDGESEEEKAGSDESCVTVIARPRVPSVSSYRKVRPGLGGGKEPRVPEEFRSTYATFTLESLAHMLEWQAIDWQRKLGVKRILPRAFYHHPLFAMNGEELREMPMARLQEHLRDVNGVLRRLFCTRPRRVHSQPTREKGGGWRKRGRGLSGCGYSTADWDKRRKEARTRGRRGWSACVLAPRRRSLNYDPARSDYARELMEGRKEKERKECFISAYSPSIPGWSKMGVKRRIQVLAMRRHAEGVAKRNRESSRVRYAKWERMEERVWMSGKNSSSPSAHLSKSSLKKEEEEKKRKEQERHAELDKMLAEADLFDDLKALRISDSSCRPPRLGESKPPSVRIDVDKEWEKRGGRKRFNLQEMFTEEENQRIVKMQAHLDDYAKILRQNKEVDETNRRRNEREEKEREFEDAKRDYWRRYHEKKRNGESVPPPPQPDPYQVQREQRASIRRDANRQAKHWRGIHAKVLARSVDHLLDVRMIDTRKK